MAPIRRVYVLAVAVALLVPSATFAANASSRPKPRQQPAAAKRAPQPAPQPAAQMPTLDLSDPTPPEPAPLAAPTPEPAPASSPATTEPLLQGEAVAPAAAAADDRIGLSVGAKLALLIPSGRTTDVAVDVANPASSVQDASRSMTGAFGLSLGYGLPFLDRALSIRAEGGVYPLSGEGTRSYPNDPDFGQMEYGYESLAIPLFFGLAFRLPLGLPLELAPTGGFAAVHSTITSTWTRDGQSTETTPVSGWALGFYAGLEGSLPLGPGALTGEVRYVNARTDLGFKEVPEYGGAFNRDLGDVQGTNVLLGYRFDF